MNEYMKSQEKEDIRETSRKMQSIIFHDRIDAANKLVEKLLWL